jgi:hypothetical protein
VTIAPFRRLAVLFAVIGGITGVGSLLLGLIFGSTVQRSVSLGFAVVGSVMLVLGFFIGMSGPVQFARRSDGSFAGVRFAEPAERVETINVSALFVGVGFVLIVIGLALDPRYAFI